jgi:hypothetical protein
MGKIKDKVILDWKATSTVDFPLLFPCFDLLLIVRKMKQRSYPRRHRDHIQTNIRRHALSVGLQNK